MNTDLDLDIISKAFQWDCDLVLQKVFLYLDPYSLKSSRQVCREWNNFIRNRLWRSPYGRRKIIERLRNNVFTEQPEEVVLEVARGGMESQVCACKADNEIVVCGLLNGTANVFSTETKSLLTVVDCQSSGGTVRLALSDNILVAASCYGVISVWSRGDYSLILRHDSLHQTNITGLQINDNFLITGDSNGVVNWSKISTVFEKSDNILVDEKKPLTDLDFRYNTVLLGSLSCLRVGTISQEGIYKSVRLIKTGYIEECKLYQSLALTSGGKYRQGIQVWDLRSGGLMRTVCPHLTFLSLEISNNVLISVMLSPTQTFPNIYVIDLAGLERGNCVRMREFPCLQATLLSPTTCASHTKIFQAQGTELKMLEFWYYQISDWDMGTFLAGIKL